MKLILLSVMLCGMAVSSKAQNAEKHIRAYLLGFEKKDWNMVASQFADDFTFTSPAGDDHISLATYEERCWGLPNLSKRLNSLKLLFKATADSLFTISLQPITRSSATQSIILSKMVK